MALGREPGVAARRALPSRRGVLHALAAGLGPLDGAVDPLRRVRADQHLRVSLRRTAARRSRGLSPRRRCARSLHQTRDRAARETAFASIAGGSTSTARNKTNPTCKTPTIAAFPKLSCPPASVYVLGDNRANSEDSRSFRPGERRSFDRPGRRRRLAAEHAGRAVTRLRACGEL